MPSSHSHDPVPAAGATQPPRSDAPAQAPAGEQREREPDTAQDAPTAPAMKQSQKTQAERGGNRQ